MLYPRMRNHSSMPALPGGPTLITAESRLHRFLFEAGEVGVREQLDTVGVGTGGGTIQASYAPSRSSARPEDGFEIRGIFSGYPDADSLPLSKHAYLAEALQDLRQMELHPKSLGSYSYVYVASAMRPALDLDGFEPQQAAGWLYWFRRLIDKAQSPYLVIVKPFRGIPTGVGRFKDLADAAAQYQNFKKNPFAAFVRFARAILLVDGRNGNAIDEFLVADRQEELSRNVIARPRFHGIQPALS